MFRTSRLALAAVAVGVLLPAGSAAAAPDRTATLDAATTSFAWDSKLGTGFTTLTNLHDRIPCGTPGVHDCDFTLLHVIGTGTVLAETTSDMPNAVDTDLYAYISDADGNKVESLGYSAQSSPTPNESMAIDAYDNDTDPTTPADNWFLIEIDYTDNIGGTIKGTATFTPSM
jgi:hypothetical protein